MRERIDAILEAGEMMLNPPEDLAGFIDKGAVKRSRTDQILDSICEEIEKMENPYPRWHDFAKVQNLHWGIWEDCRQKILTLLRSKGNQPVGPGMWGECPAGSTGVEGPPGSDRD